MTNHSPLPRHGMLHALARDTSGNTIALIAASLMPMLAMAGGGIDLGRAYLAQARLQQACDAGVLAARKRLGSEAAVSGNIPVGSAEIGQRFFNVNFGEGAYGSSSRDFEMTLEDDFSVSGAATTNIPTTIMGMFGTSNMPIEVTCEAQINFNNTDIMMVLDTTGSMNETNPGDSSPRITQLKATVRSFYDQLAMAATAGTRIRYGFVPYSTNVNVGGLLDDDWVTPTWSYQSRKLLASTQTVYTYTYYTASSPVSGSPTITKKESYAASFDEVKGYYCATKPADKVSTSYKTLSTKSEVFVGPPAGTKITKTIERTRSGTWYTTTMSGTTCTVMEAKATNYVDTYSEVTQPRFGSTAQWWYGPISTDVANWRADSNGCIEERDTYEISDYSNVDLSKARDLDIDSVPVAGDPRTQWRPMYPGLIYARELEWSGAGAMKTAPKTTDKEYVSPAGLGTAACPAPAHKMAEMSRGDLDAYLGTLNAGGSTYHDIGMIWGGRLLSPTGLFASENSDVSSSSPSSRHLIFLTDGLTAPLDLSYSSYGIEPIDQRRWHPTSKRSLAETVEQRFAFACKEVKRRNITVWVVGFGTELNPVLRDCAGEGHYFEAKNAIELNATFATIAKNLSQLRIQR